MAVFEIVRSNPLYFSAQPKVPTASLSFPGTLNPNLPCVSFVFGSRNLSICGKLLLSCLMLVTIEAGVISTVTSIYWSSFTRGFGLA